MLEGQAQEVYRKMKEEGRVTELSDEDTRRLDKRLSFPDNLRVDFNRKSRNSEIYSVLNESGYLNYNLDYKKD